MERHARRIARVQARLAALDVHALVVAPGADLVYLTGYDALALERPTLLIVRADGPATIVAPLLERARVQGEVLLDDLAVVTYGEHDDALVLAADRIGGAPGSVVALGDTMWTSFTLGIQRALPDHRWAVASDIIGPERVVKDAEELVRLRAVAAAIDAVHRRVPEVLRAGRTEQAVAADLATMIRDGHDEVSFVIVASGPNAASPHHEPGPRTIEEGDVVVVDIGGVLDGYCSDMTRMYAVGHAPPEFLAPYAVLERAQAAAVAAVRPGATAGEVDAAARDVLAEAGLGDAFVHRTGHGIGMQTHEEPWILGGSTVALVPGMAFSVEPGFYLDGRFGARIEDIVVVTEEGVEVLNVVPRDLVVVR